MLYQYLVVSFYTMLNRPLKAPKADGSTSCWATPRSSTRLRSAPPCG